MSKLAEKIHHGEKPSEADWQDHLIEAHRRGPSMTPRTFAAHRSVTGDNSYELLARSFSSLGKPGAQVVDLACGDGFLIPFLLQEMNERGRVVGVDMSEGELAVGRKQVIDPRVSFVCAKAQDLPLETSSVDLVLSHMAFMLMLPIEPVISELARVLKPQGRFSAVVGNPKARSGLWAELQSTSFRFMDARYPMIKETRAGDSRVGTEEGIRSLFTRESGFECVEEVTDFALDVRLTPFGVWEFMREMYFVDLIKEDDKRELSKILVDFGQRNADSSGLVSFQFPMRRFTASKM